MWPILLLFSLTPPQLPPHRAASRTSRAAAPRAVDDESKGALGGAVLGGLIAGPFGALWGASLGSSMGAAGRERREEEARLAAMGLDREAVRLAAALAAELAEAEASVSACEEAERSQSNLGERLAAAAAEQYAAAEEKLRAGDEESARALLVERQETQAKAARADAELQEARDRTLSVRRAVSVLSTRAAELEASLDQAAARKAVGSGPVAGAVEAAPPEDPLLARFKDLEGGK
uniref:Glycine zipper domain-containing protein n=1 Tax=Emiliania huxleyi TaxID=2903 RepID=A0A6V2PN52_EMIHU|mmetsp:Transcript_23878/g.77008  ORF Transcript_23878/g.77008 Transcript_23878/m.77008 type:complete len:235 (+) Transcript_23878:47-751(+)